MAEWKPQDISQDGVWVKRTAADKRIKRLMILGWLLNAALWGIGIFNLVIK